MLFCYRMPCCSLWRRTAKADASDSPPEALSFANPKREQGVFF
jgi:hypothetical protein